MILDTRHLLSPTVIKADICIVGGGVAGIVLANELQKTFNRIVVIESGEEKFANKNQILNRANTVKWHYFDPEKSRLRMLGGASNHWENNTAEFIPSDFLKKDWIANSGWPITYNEVAKYYLNAAEYCGTGRDGYYYDYWKQQTAETSSLDGSDNFVSGVSKHAQPPTRFFAKFKETLTESSKVHIYISGNAVDLDFDEKSGNITSLYFKRINGEHLHKVEASQYILASGGIENARLLLHFNKSYANKLGNQFDNVGRYFMDHPTIRPAQFYPKRGFKWDLVQTNSKNRNIYSFFRISDETIKSQKLINMKLSLFEANEFVLSNGISSAHILQEGFEKSTFPDYGFKHIGNVLSDIDMVIEGLARQTYGKRIFDSAEYNAGYYVHVMLEQSPHRENRITLSENNDVLGIPKVDITWKIREDDIDRMWKGLEILANEVGQKDFGRIRLLKEHERRLFGDQMGFGHHHMGTTRMSESEKTGVVDESQKVFGTENFYIAGSSVFPTGSHVPPTLTIVATSIRLARHIEKKVGTL